MTTTSSQRDPSLPTAPARMPSENVGIYIPPHRNGTWSAEHRYSKDQLLSLYREEMDSSRLKDDMSKLYVHGWEPSISNGTSTSWSRREEKESHAGPDLCWVPDGSVIPQALQEMTAEEKEVSFPVLVDMVSFANRFFFLLFYSSFPAPLIRLSNRHHRMLAKMTPLLTAKPPFLVSSIALEVSIYHPRALLDRLAGGVTRMKPFLSLRKLLVLACQDSREIRIVMEPPIRLLL